MYAQCGKSIPVNLKTQKKRSEVIHTLNITFPKYARNNLYMLNKFVQSDLTLSWFMCVVNVFCEALSIRIISFVNGQYCIFCLPRL